MRARSLEGSDGRQWAAFSSIMKSFTFVSIAGFALIFSFLLGGDKDHSPQSNSADLSGAEWISTNHAATTGYFRKTFALPFVPEKAYLIVTATESVEVFVNDRKAGELALVQHQPTIILDVRPKLASGNNVIALQVDTLSEHMAPAIRARLVLEAGGLTRVINSDTSWAATGLPVIPLGSSVRWNSSAYVDSQWPQAIAIDPPSLPVRPPEAPEYLYQTFPNGSWIWDDDSADTETRFLRTFFLDGSNIMDAWLGIGVSGQYSVSINGMTLYSYRGQARTPSVMDVFNISPLLRIGENQLLVNVEGETPGPQLTVSGFVSTDATLSSLNSDGRWFVVREHERNLPVAVRPIDRSSDALQLQIQDVGLPAMLEAERLETQFYLFVLVLSGVAVIMAILCLLCYGLLGHLTAKDVTAFAVPLFWAAVVATILLLLRFDTRVDDELPFRPIVIISFMIAIAAWEILILLEKAARR